MLILRFLLCVGLLSGGAIAQKVKYGANAAVGKTFEHDGVKLYYEVYGKGEPLLVIHGNGSSIGELAAEIDYFRKQYQVIAMDSRDHGKSADSKVALNYEKMTDDLAALLDHLQVGPVRVLGWSDGGIEALLLAMRHPAKVKMIASMAANLVPEGAHPEALQLIEGMLKDPGMSARDRKVASMMLKEPQIPLKSLEGIQAPTLVLAGDHDLIADEHTLDIYHHLPNSQLCIFPNATHMIPYDDPALFNATVDRFFRTPFVKKDRVKDLLKTMEKMKAGEKK